MTAVDTRNMIPGAFRKLCRSGAFTEPTAGVCQGYGQANLVILPASFAAEFERFCACNGAACPVLEVTAVGDYAPRRAAPNADLRTDLPRYRVYRGGQCVDRPMDITAYWPDESARLVAFLIGCSFTFEWALLEANIPVRHIEQRRNVPMYRTNRSCEPAGPFRGPLIVSMRPMRPEQAEAARRITARCPRVHGPPIHVGDPSVLGLKDLDRPDYGDAVEIRPGEVPVFWACGVTPMDAVMQAAPPLAITHEPGHMFVTDLPDRSVFDPSAGS